MKPTNETLQDAIGMIDDDLITEARPIPKRKPQRSVFLKWSAVAACLTVAFAATALLFPPSFQMPAETQQTSITPPGSEPTYYAPTVATNLWELDNFSTFSVVFGEATGSSASRFVPLSSAPNDNTIQSTLLSIADISNVKIESLIDERYIAYYEGMGIPVLYDLQEKCQVNLDERILGENRFDGEKFFSLAEKKLEEICPGVTLSENNRIYLRERITSIYYDIPFTPSVEPDLTYVAAKYKQGEQYYYYTDERLANRFDSDCIAAEAAAYQELYEEHYSIPYRIRLLAMDSISGVCVVRVNDLTGNGLDYLTYNIATDVCTPLPTNDANNIIGSMQEFGSVFHFSNTGSIISVSFPRIDSDNHTYYDLWQRQFYPSTTHRVTYYGEQYGCFFIDYNSAFRLDKLCPDVRGISQVYVSPNNTVVYYKKYNLLHAERYMTVESNEWYHRLEKLNNKDTDEWIFGAVEHIQGRGSYIQNGLILLQGNFVRFIANETAVVMERGGKYYAYSLTDGSDITRQVINYEIPLMAHDRLQIYLEDGYLYSKDLFSDEAPKQIAKADQVIFSNDGAFAFIYNQGDSFVTCLNVASLDSCRIEIDSALCDQLFSTPDAVFQMIYKEDENTLTLSFYEENKPE